MLFFNLHQQASTSETQRRAASTCTSTERSLRQIKTYKRLIHQTVEEA